MTHKSLFSAILVLAVGVVAAPSTVFGQVSMGETDFSVGARTLGGFLYDAQAPSSVGEYVGLVGLQAQLGLLQQFIPQASLAAEASVGFMSFGASTLSRKGVAPASTDFAMGIDLIGRFYPFGDGTQYRFGDGNAPYIGAGLGGEWVFRPEGTLTAFSLAGRLGWSFEVEEERLKVEFGYQYPIIYGLAADTTSMIQTNTDKKEKNHPDTAYLHQFILSINFTI